MDKLREKIKELEEEIVNIHKEYKKSSNDEIIKELNRNNQMSIINSVNNIETITRNICKQTEGNAISKEFILEYYIPFIKQEFEMEISESERKKVDSVFEKSEKNYKRYDKPKTYEQKQKFIKEVMREEPIEDKEFVNYDKEPDIARDEKKFKQDIRFKSFVKIH